MVGRAQLLSIGSSARAIDVRVANQRLRRLFRGVCVWRDRLLIVELDGRGAHLTAHAFEKDRSRDRVVLMSEWRSTRVTWRMLHRDGDEIEADLRVLLAVAA